MEGEKLEADKAYEFIETQPDDYYIFSYTSGTTGDSKGVKLTHRNIIAATFGVDEIVKPELDDTIISYLPYPHSFEQALTSNSIINGFRIGYY